MSSYAFTLTTMTQVDADDVAGWVDRARADLDASIERLGETGSVLRLAATVLGKRVRLTVYKGYGRVRLEGGDGRAQRYLAEQLELTVVAEVVRTLPGGAVTNGAATEAERQKALMEMFRTLGSARR